jgi:NAD(P)H-hydrate epimerase
LKFPPPILNRESVRQLDRRATEEFGVPGIVLMENAGRGVADKLCELGIAGTVVICCGPGNNGGDGFVIARHLDLRGVAVKVFTWGWQPPLAGGQRPPGDAATNLSILEASGIAIHYNADPSALAAAMAGAAWIVDALLGTGSHGEPRSPLDEIISTINASGVPVMAIVLPSGLDCDTGEAAKHTIRAQHTCTFVAAKPGFLIESAKQYTGQVHVCDIGAPRVLVEEMLARNQDTGAGT